MTSQIIPIRKKTKHNAFCLSHDSKQSSPTARINPHNKLSKQKQIIHKQIKSNLLLNQNLFITNSLFNPLFSRKIHITTRNNPEVNTYTIPIRKRHRGPNKTKTERDMTTPQEKNTIATQTDETSNLGLGRQP